VRKPLSMTDAGILLCVLVSVIFCIASIVEWDLLYIRYAVAAFLSTFIVAIIGKVFSSL